jgi:hypothetical protein
MYSGADRVLLLATNYILAQAETIEEIYQDGTFQACPKPFYQARIIRIYEFIMHLQLFFVRGRVQGTPRVIVIVLLPGATEHDYDVTHEMLCKATGGRLRPKKSMSEFEKGIANSTCKTYPDIVVSVDLYFS